MNIFKRGGVIEEWNKKRIYIRTCTKIMANNMWHIWRKIQCRNSSESKKKITEEGEKNEKNR